MIEKTKKNAALSFEEAYNRLTETADKLEQGGLPLDESLALFEEGTLLARLCEELLAKAELKVSQLTPAAPVSVASRSYTFTTAEADEDDESDTTGDADEDDDWSDDDLRNALNELKF